MFSTFNQAQGGFGISAVIEKSYIPEQRMAVDLRHFKRGLLRVDLVEEGVLNELRRFSQVVPVGLYRI